MDENGNKIIKEKLLDAFGNDKKNLKWIDED